MMWFLLLAVHLSRYGCTWEVWRVLERLELLLTTALGNHFELSSCSPFFPFVSVSRYTQTEKLRSLHFGSFSSKLGHKFGPSLSEIGFLFRLTYKFLTLHHIESKNSKLSTLLESCSQ